MIQPTIRASLRPEDVEGPLEAGRPHDPATVSELTSVLETHGPEELLLDRRARRLVLRADLGLSLRPRMAVFLYAAALDSLDDVGIRQPVLADYLACLVQHFLHGTPCEPLYPMAPDGPTLPEYLEAASAAGARKAQRMREDAAEFALWLSGVWHEWLAGRAERRGAPGADYYASIGQSLYHEMCAPAVPRSDGLEPVCEAVAHRFGEVRASLNEVADRFLFPDPSKSADRLLERISLLDASRHA